MFHSSLRGILERHDLGELLLRLIQAHRHQRIDRVLHHSHIRIKTDNLEPCRIAVKHSHKPHHQTKPSINHRLLSMDRHHLLYRRLRHPAHINTTNHSLPKTTSSLILPGRILLLMSSHQPSLLSNPFSLLLQQLERRQSHLQWTLKLLRRSWPKSSVT